MQMMFNKKKSIEKQHLRNFFKHKPQDQDGIYNDFSLFFSPSMSHNDDLRVSLIFFLLHKLAKESINILMSKVIQR